MGVGWPWHRALTVFCIARLVAASQQAPSELPQPVAFPAGTTGHADVLQLLPVGEVESKQVWLWDGPIGVVNSAYSPGIPPRPKDANLRCWRGFLPLSDVKPTGCRATSESSCTMKPCLRPPPGVSRFPMSLGCRPQLISHTAWLMCQCFMRSRSGWGLTESCPAGS
jgi:hypothetical protein